MRPVVRRSVDYLETREDIDHTRLAYWGISWGAEIAPVALAVEPRFAVGLLMDGGAVLVPLLPEADESVFAPRVRVPVLMLGGSHDVVFPLETSQKLMFSLLGTPEEHKRHVVFDTGHAVLRLHRGRALKEMLDWLDRYLGPIE